MAKKDSFVKGGFVRAWHGVWDNVSAWVVTFVSTGVVTWATAVSQFMQTYAPFSWAVAAVLAFFVSSSAMALLGIYKSRKAMADFEDKRSEAQSVNPKRETFTRERINLSDFYHPFFKPTVGVRFQDCDIFGPATIFLTVPFVDAVEFQQCDFVVVTGNSGVHSAMHFDGCFFVRCRFFRIMVLVTQEQLESITQIGGGVRPNLLTYERPKDAKAKEVP